MCAGQGKAGLGVSPDGGMGVQWGGCLWLRLGRERAELYVCTMHLYAPSPPDTHPPSRTHPIPAFPCPTHISPNPSPYQLLRQENTHIAAIYIGKTRITE